MIHLPNGTFITPERVVLLCVLSVWISCCSENLVPGCGIAVGLWDTVRWLPAEDFQDKVWITCSRWRKIQFGPLKNISGYSRNPCSLNRERDAACLMLWECLLRDRCLKPYRIMTIHWLMARRRPWRTHVCSPYRRTRHLLLRFLCRKEPCRQHEELGSKRSVSFPVQRTRVTWVTQNVLFHRFTY